jgi:hypothetical protein
VGLALGLGVGVSVGVAVGVGVDVEVAVGVGVGAGVGLCAATTAKLTTDGRRFTFLADDRLTAFLELYAAIHPQLESRRNSDEILGSNR